jgi:hypothetical protein
VKVTLLPASAGLLDAETEVVVAAGFTTCDSADEVRAAYVLSPAYSAVILCADPVAVRATVTAPAPPASDTVPSDELPSLIVTLPVGVAPAPETVAVKVTNCPETEGLTELETTTAGVSVWTVCVKADEVAEAK